MTDDDPDAILGAQHVSKGARRGQWPGGEADAPMHGIIVAFLLAALFFAVGVGLVVVLT